MASEWAATSEAELGWDTRRSPWSFMSVAAGVGLTLQQNQKMRGLEILAGPQWCFFITASYTRRVSVTLGLSLCSGDWHFNSVVFRPLRCSILFFGSSHTTMGSMATLTTLQWSVLSDIMNKHVGVGSLAWFGEASGCQVRPGYSGPSGATFFAEGGRNSYFLPLW